MESKDSNHPDLLVESNNDQPRGRRGQSKRTQKTWTYGEIPGIKPGHRFEKKAECYAAGIHGKIYAGIHGSQETGAYSVCLSGVYKDDVDYGDFIIYTGAGGQADPFTGDHRHIGEQTLNHPNNAALLVSLDLEQPVRVVRKIFDKETYFRYDGLYLVEKAYLDDGAEGYLVCRFEMRRLPGQLPLPT